MARPGACRWAACGLALLACFVGGPARADHHERDESSEDRYYDTGRFYFYFQSGHRFVLDKDLVDDLEFENPSGIDLVLGGGGGYNISDHWGVELQAHGTEIDVRSASRGKVEEYSNITIVPAVRFRWPVHGGRLVPYLTGGVGYSLNDDNDTGNPRFKVTADDSTIAGAVAAGIEYFVNPNVAIGIGLHSWIYPDQDARFTVRDASNAVILDEEQSFNQTSLALLAHVRLFLGQPGEPGNMSLRRLFLADHPPFDTGETRVYLYGLGGHTFQFDEDAGGGVELKAPGDFNATVGVGLGVNFDEHWSVEAQWFNVAPNVNLSPYGKFTEVDNNTALLVGRFRWPFLQGRLVPYVTAGVGGANFDVNDNRSVVDIPTQQGTAVTAPTPAFDIQATAVAATGGIGVEYFLNHHLSIGVALPFYVYPDLATRLQLPSGQVRSGNANFSGIAPQLQIKGYLN